MLKSKVGLLVALAMLPGVLSPAAAQIDIMVKGVCPGVWVTMPSANYESVKVCKRDGSANTRHIVAHRREVKAIAKASPARAPVLASEQLAFVTQGFERECVALSCPGFLLTGVGY